MSHGRRHPILILWLLVLAVAIASAASVAFGSTRLSLGEVVHALLGSGDQWASLVLLEMRLPRLVLGLLMGMGISVSGAIMQGVTRNDLASPDTVGVNAGSGLGMMLVLVAYPTAAAVSPMLVPGVSILGALGTTALIFALAYRRGTVLPTRLLLVGVAVGFGAHAAMLLFSMRMSFVMYNSVLAWLSGTLAATNWTSILVLLPCCVVLIPLAMSRSRVLDLLSLGDGVAASLGVAVQRQRLLLLAMATMLTSVCVAIGGHIGFLGLAAPHLARRLVGINHAVLLPASALVGAALLLVADLLARNLFAPIEMPAGVFVAVLGGAYFLYLLATTKG